MDCDSENAPAGPSGAGPLTITRWRGEGRRRFPVVSNFGVILGQRTSSYFSAGTLLRPSPDRGPHNQMGNLVFFPDSLGIELGFFLAQKITVGLEKIVFRDFYVQ